ncbi:hypothetical protein NSE01_05310 [Novosphingobium sediminis]|uniref:DUF3240 domain-containing protein n=1 Tax=Novosphingobium sediminis TaxID=707214 RepID=A0A512AG63_9SPHN|nr:DUF3240 family protein [Novosphingobium sediminis]GEN98698.1 hypothetical protein NSE01_05310 [Novosphingobium sediminis]
MADVLLTLHCAAADAEVIGEALRAALQTPVHVRAEAVLGLDFSDATTAERVTARLDRRAIELVLPEGDIPEALGILGRVRRSGAVRWYTSAVLERGRVA